MKRLLIVVTLISFLPVTWAEECSLTSPADLQNYITTFASRVPPLTESLQSTPQVEEFLNVWNNCQAIVNLRGLGACYERAVSVASMIRRRANVSGRNSMAMEVSDQDYYNSVPDEAKSLPVELQNGLPANYRELAQQKGWKVFQYRSRTVPNPGNGTSYNRVLILVEGRPYDKFIQFTVGEYPNLSAPQRLVDFISVNNEATPKSIFFTQFWRDTDGTHPQNRATIGASFDTCIVCHPNGMRELSPAPGSFSREDAPMLSYINRKMEGYKKLDWGVGFRPEAYGPGRGMENGCVRCHNGYTGDPNISRGALHPFVDDGHIQHKLLDDLSMSPTSSKKRKEALEYLENIPQVLDEATRAQMMAELYTGPQGSSLSDSLRTLRWMNTHNRPDGQPWLSAADLVRFTDTLTEMGLENMSVANNLSQPNQQAMSDWLLDKCPHDDRPSPVVNQAPRSEIREQQPSNRNNQRGQRGAAQQ